MTRYIMHLARVLQLHWLACDGCSRFRRQVEVMRGALGRGQAPILAFEDQAGHFEAGAYR